MSRFNYSDRKIVEETLKFTIQAIQKSEVLINNNTAVFMPISNSQVNGFLVTAYNNGNNSYFLQIQYNYMGQEKETNIDITSIPCNFGGIRYYFLCPISEKKVTALYVGDNGVMASRENLELVYKLSRYHRDITEDLCKSNNHRLKAEEYRLLGHPRKAKKKDIQAAASRKIAYEKLTNYFKDKNEFLKEKYKYILDQ